MRVYARLCARARLCAWAIYLTIPEKRLHVSLFHDMLSKEQKKGMCASLATRHTCRKRMARNARYLKYNATIGVLSSGGKSFTHMPFSMLKQSKGVFFYDVATNRAREAGRVECISARISAVAPGACAGMA